MALTQDRWLADRPDPDLDLDVDPGPDDDDAPPELPEWRLTVAQAALAASLRDATWPDAAEIEFAMSGWDHGRRDAIR